MMTLLPVAAFAADAAGTPDRHASILKVDKTKVEADLKKDAEFTVYVRDSKNKDNYDGNEQWVYAASERGTTDLIVPDFDNKDGAKYKAVYIDLANGNEIVVEGKEADNSNLEVKDKDGNDVTVRNADEFAEAVSNLLEAKEFSNKVMVAVQTNERGKAVLKLKSTVAGDAKVAIGLKGDIGTDRDSNNPYTYLTDSDVTADKAGIIGSKTVTFEATDANDITVENVEIRSGSSNVDFAPTERDYDKEKSSIKVEEGKRYYKAFVKDKTKDKVKANGSDYFEMKFRLTSENGAPVENEKVTFSVNKSQARLNKYSAETDEVGEAKVKVYADKAGKYEVKATKGSYWAKVEVEFDPSSMDNFVVVKDLEGKVAYNEDHPAYIKLQMLDANGNDFDIPNKEPADLADEYVDGELINFEWVTKPKDSDVDDDDWKDGNSTAELTSDNGLLKIMLPKLDEEGKYALKISLESGKSKTFEFEAKEQGDIVKLELEYDEEVLPLDTLSNEPTLTKYDADGVKLEVKDLENYDWSVSDYKLLTKKNLKEENGKVILTTDKTGENVREYNIKNEKGAIATTDDDDYTGELVVTVIDTTNDLTTSTIIEVADAATGLNVVEEGNFVVGEDNEVKLVVKDRKGNNVSLGNVSGVTLDYYVLSQPEGANVSVDEGTQFAKNLKEKGEATVKVYSNKEGKAKISFVVTHTDNNNVEKKFTKVAEFNFGEKKEVKTIGAKNVTLFINGTGYVVDGVAKVTDVAPFIQDNRTFVPVRIVAEALGCENEDTMWDPATQTVTLEREDLTITMTIGSNILTVSTGETVVSDVAPFIKDGRTVLPFRAIAEAFGADVEAIFAADGSVTGVTFEQE